MIPTYLYDIDPALGSTNMPFFTELAGIYRRYRLVKCKMVLSFANRETFPVVVYIVPDNSDPGNNSATPATFFSNPLCKKMVIGGTSGNNRGTLRHSFTVAQFAGSVDAHLDDQYSARMDGTGGQPPQAITFVFGCVTTGSDNLTTTGGLSLSIDLKLTFDVFEVTSPPS